MNRTSPFHRHVAELHGSGLPPEPRSGTPGTFKIPEAAYAPAARPAGQARGMPFVFDLLELDGHDLIREPVEAREAELSSAASQRRGRVAPIGRAPRG